jgi:serine/threonine protein kinase/tetratricopeptide (TPR) repeat protein
MTPERWKQIEEIFHEALGLEPFERSEFLSRRGEGDEELQIEVEKLIKQFEEASSFIEEPVYDSENVAAFPARLAESGKDPIVGKVLGNYVVDREIGRGGMGAVYEGRRADGEFRLRVAIKVVKRGVDTDFVLKRFRNERQILAALDHPFITRLIDGGTTPDGRPYFVMEHIDGFSLYRYCERRQLNIKERLALFGRICEAVAYAHQKLVIHRDLKPSNIIVCDDATPRLLDFGIAKLLDPSMASDTLQPTAAALRMMTVDYASPEQIRGETVTYETDVYSLGVILFELLTGRRPYPLTSRSPHEIAKAICEEEPVLPSRSVSEAGTPSISVNSTSTTLIDADDIGLGSTSNLAGILQGSLDNIVMKALRKDPGQRYASVQALREDVLRYLNGESVSGPHYFSRRLVRSSTIQNEDTRLVAVLPLSVMSPSGSETTDESYLTIGLADAIIMRLTSVEKLTVRPTSSITRYHEHQVNPFRAGIELGVDFILDGRIRRFGERLRISLQLLDVKRGAAIWAGQFDEHLTDVLELEDAISKQVAAALIPHLTGDERQKLAARGTNSPKAHEEYLRGRFYWNQFTSQSLPKALKSFERAIEIDPDYALAYVGIADFYIWANIYGLIPVRESYEQARTAAVRALEINDRLGEVHASMGLIVLNQFDYEKAEDHLRRSISLSPKYSLGHEWYSSLRIGTGYFEEGLESMRRAEEIDPLSLRTKTLVAWSYYQSGELDLALKKADEIINLDQNYPQGHLQRGYILTEFARYEEAISSIERSMDLMPGSSLAQYHLCFALAAAGRKEDAKSLVDEMKDRAKTEYVKPMFLGLACLAAGELDEGFRYLKTAADERDPWMVWLGTEPKLKPFRDDPRYLDLLHTTRKTFRSGRLQPIDIIAKSDHTSVVYSDEHTLVDLEIRTEGYGRRFLRQHLFKIAAISILIAGMVLAYQFGILAVKIGPELASPLKSVPRLRSVAVLPFVNKTGNPANDYISDGMSESLLTRLGGLPDIRTVPRSTMFSYRSRAEGPIQLGKELGVDSVVTGTLSRKGDSFEVETKLLSVFDASEVFTFTSDDSVDRTYAIGDRIGEELVRFLTPNGSAPTLPVASTMNNEAFQLYLKGEFHRQKGTPADTMTSLKLYEDAIKLDPAYALAYQGMALALRSAPAYGALAPGDAYPRAKDAALKAVSIDPSLSTANVALAALKATFDWDFRGAEEQYKRALQMAPNNAEAHYSYANFLVAMGRVDEALSEYRFAQQADPLSQNIATNIGWALYIAGRYDEALAAIREVIARDPGYGRAYLNLGEILQEQKQFTEAIAAFQRARELTKDPIADMALGHALADSGRAGEARKIAMDLEEKVRQKQVSPFLPAVVYAGLKEKDRAFYWLERSYQERSNWLTLIKVGRRLRSLQDDPRFDDLLKRVGF